MARAPRIQAGPASEAAYRALSAQVRPAVEKRLRALWQRRRRALARYGRDVQEIVDAASDLTLRGGKRYRAVLLTAAFSGVRPKAPATVAIDASCALELLQTYLLIQDDWMDGDTSRRGGPTVHVALGRALGSEVLGAHSAILASDLTWGMAVGTLAGLDVPAARRLTALQEFTQVHEDVVVGQQLDCVGRAEDVDLMHSLKTGSYTVRGPVLLGAQLAGADEAILRRLRAMSKPLGLAFQLRDDLLGLYGASRDMGRPPGTDLRAGKRTALIAEADARLDAKGRRVLARAFGRKGATAAEIEAATGVLDQCGARRAVTQRLWSLCDRAASMAHALPISADGRMRLAGAAEVLRVRSDAS